MIELDYRGDVAILRMAYGKANALNLEFLQALTTTLTELEESLLVRAVVLTSNGSMFGAGVDLPALVAGGPDYVRKFVPRWSTFLRVWRDFLNRSSLLSTAMPLPVVR